MLHARELALRHPRVRAEERVGDDEAEDGVADELERLVMKAARLFLAARSDLLVRPRAMRDGALKQRGRVEFEGENFFQRRQAASCWPEWCCLFPQ